MESALIKVGVWKTTSPDYSLDYGRLTAYCGVIFHEYEIASVFAGVPVFFVYEYTESYKSSVLYAVTVQFGP